MLKLHDYISMDSFGPIMTVKQKLKQEMAFALKLAVFTVVKKKVVLFVRRDNLVKLD